MRRILLAVAILTATLTASSGIVAAPFLPVSSDRVAVSSRSTGLPSAPALNVERVHGMDRYATAAALVQAWPSGVAVAYVASGEQFADATTAAALAGATNAPMLLTKSNALPASTEKALRRLKPTRVVVVGGASAVSDSVLRRIRPRAASGAVIRIAGEDRYASAAMVAESYPADPERVFLVGGGAFADALTAAALAGLSHAPVLFTESDVLHTETATALRRMSPDEIVVVGGTERVPDTVALQGASYTTSKTFRRLSGKDRYETAEHVAKQFPAGASSVYVASGEDFADALVGAALAGNKGVPIILIPSDRVAPATRRAIDYLDPGLLIVLGGSAAISDSAVSALSQATSNPGRVLFDAEFAASGLSKYGSVHNANRIKVVNDPGPLGASRKVLRFEVYESDDQLTGDPRAQAETPRMFREGDEIWVGFSTYFPTDWPDKLPLGNGNFVTFGEVYGPPYAGSSPVKITMRAGQNKLTFQRNETYSWDIPWESGPIQKNTWHDWVIREKLSRDGRLGFVEIYRNVGTGWKVMPLFGETRLYTQTIDSSNAVGPQYHKISLYYAAEMKLTNPMVMYFADHKIATSFAAAAPRSYEEPPAGPPK